MDIWGNYDTEKNSNIRDMVIYKQKKALEEEENQPYEVAELICLGCHQRWIGVYPVSTTLKELECKCGTVGLVIKTGQTILGVDE